MTETDNTTFVRSGVRARVGAARAAALAALLVLALGAPPAAAAPGDLDRSFSGDGRVVTDLQAGSDDRALAATVDAQGRLVLAGYSFKSPEGIRLAVVRYLPGGALDPGFGGDGIVLDTHAGGFAARGLGIDSRGRIVLAGPNGNGEPIVARLLPNGRIDPAFGRGGVVNLPYDREPRDFDPRALAIDASDRIVVAGGLYERATLDFAAVRLLPDGSLDPGLGGEGIVAHNLGPADVANDVFLDRYGRIVLAGVDRVRRPQPPGPLGDFAVARLLPDGRLDASFGGDGKAVIAMNRAGSFAAAAALDGAGNAILAGRAAPRAGLAKVRGAGRLGRGFGRGGRVKLGVRGAQWAKDVAVDLRGRPLVAIGTPRLGAPGAGALIAARLRPNGRPDGSFSRDGRALAGFGRWRATATAIALYRRGPIAVAGHARHAGAGGDDFVAARFRGG